MSYDINKKVYATKQIEQTISDNILFADELKKCINKHNGNKQNKDISISCYKTIEGTICIKENVPNNTLSIFFSDEMKGINDNE